MGRDHLALPRLYAMSCCHDELVMECPEDQAEEVATFAGEVMVVTQSVA